MGSCAAKCIFYRKEAIKEKVVEDWWEQVGEKSSLGWYGRVKEEFTVEEC